MCIGTTLSQDASVDYNSGVAKAATGKYEFAIREFSRAINKKPDYREAYEGRARAFAKLNEFDLAICDFDLLIAEMQLEDPKLYFDRGQAKYENKDYVGSIADFYVALAINPDYVNALYFLAMSYLLNQDNQTALVYFNILVDKKPDHAVGYYGLGNVYYQMDAFKQAFKFFDLAIQKDPGHDEARYNRAKSAYKIGEFAKAEKDYDYLLKYNQQAHYYYNRGHARARMENKQGACDDWKKALNMGVSEANKYISQFCN